jgi:hypothetical protein
MKMAEHPCFKNTVVVSAMTITHYHHPWCRAECLLHDLVDQHIMQD